MHIASTNTGISYANDNIIAVSQNGHRPVFDSSFLRSVKENGGILHSAIVCDRYKCKFGAYES